MAFAPVPFRVSEVFPRLLFGTAPQTAADRAVLLARGVTAVLDLRSQASDGVSEVEGRAFWSGTPVAYLRDAMVDDGRAQPAAAFVRGVGFVADALARDPSGAVVYIHCHAGQYRSPAMVYAVLRAAGYSAAEAWSRVQSARADTFRQYVPSAEAAVGGLPPIDATALSSTPPGRGASPVAVALALGGAAALLAWLASRRR